MAIAAGALALTGCASGHTTPAPQPAQIQPLPTTGKLDYQLGGAVAPREGVTVVARDRTDEPATGVYSICYINGFQTQPAELPQWSDDLVLKVDGEPLADPGWPDEVVLDTSTADKRQRIATIVGEWIAGCAADGFAAVEFDNLDSYSRSQGMLTADDNLALAELLVQRAHEEHLAAGQKNALELGTRGRDVAQFDFAVAEECHEFDECGAFAEIWGERFVDIEYTDTASLDSLCDDADLPKLSVVRDRELSPGGETWDCEAL